MRRKGGRTTAKPDCPVEHTENKELLQTEVWTFFMCFRESETRTLLDLMDRQIFCLFSPRRFSIVALRLPAMGNTFSLCFHPRYQKQHMGTHVGLLQAKTLQMEN